MISFISAPVYDGYSNALSEGRYIGAIPIVNAIPGNLELIRHKENGCIVEPFEPDLLTQTLEEILADTDAWKRKFSGQNTEWILKNAHLKTNIRHFLDLCEESVHPKQVLSS